MNPAHNTPRARLVPKAPSLNVAQEPPVPVVTSSPKAKSKDKISITQQEKQQQQQRREELLAQAEELSQQNQGLNPQNAYEILLGQYTLDEWKARRQVSLEKKRHRFQQRKEAQLSDKRSEQEKGWSFRFFEATEVEPIWMETTSGDHIVRVTKMKPFLLGVQIADGSYRGFPKTEISTLCSAGQSTQVQSMRQVEPESQRDMLPAKNPKERWLFPESSFAGWIGSQVRVQLLNGSTWTGFLRWNSHFTFLLGAQPEGEHEVLLFKHACCGVQLV